MSVMSLEMGVRIAGGIILLLLNAFYVATEFALTRLRQFDKSELDETPGLQRAWKMTETLEIYLTSCQIGITTTSILLGVVAEPAVTELFLLIIPGGTPGTFSSYSISIVLSVSLINFVHTIWGEQTPTYLGVERARSVARYCAPPLYWWTYAIYPVLVLGDRITKFTLRLFGIEMERSWLKEESPPVSGNIQSEMVTLLKSEGLPRDRQDEVVKALEIDSIPVTKIMVPRDEIVTLTTRRPFGENLEIVKKHMHARYPLIGYDLEDFKGILYTPEILAHVEQLRDGSRELDDFDWPRMTVPADMPVSELIDRFQEKHHELALVMKNGRVTGLVTLTDTFEAIIGSAEDPLDLIGGGPGGSKRAP